MNLDHGLIGELTVKNNLEGHVPMFEKRTIVELNENELADINGGTSAPCVGISIGIAYSVGQIGIWGYEFGQWLR